MVPVGMESAQIYDALSKKTIDGVFFYSGAGLLYGFGEVAKTFILMGVANGGGTINMNMDSWNKLPADLQQIFLDVGETYLPEAYRKIYDDVAEADGATMKKNGITLYRLSPQDQQYVIETGGKTVVEDWAKFATANGGQNPMKAWDAYVAGCKKYSKYEFPKVIEPREPIYTKYVPVKQL
ncbi:MAG: hypothetical protein PHR56_04935, partial [Dehalococcoidales bacterium]|nr:hypothetical protein [Dehalococcoidales bacterium]